MIVQMKKVSLIVLESEKNKALKKLRKLGLLHVEINEGSGEKLAKLKEQISSLESGMFTVAEKADKKTVQKALSSEDALKISEKVLSLNEEKKTLGAEKSAHTAELERLKAWGEIAPEELALLAQKGIELSLYEMSSAEYGKLDDTLFKTLVLSRDKKTVRFILIKNGTEECDESSLDIYRVQLPSISTAEIKAKITEIDKRLNAVEDELSSYAAYTEGMKNAVEGLQKDVEFETYSTGMAQENLSQKTNGVSVAYLSGYIPTAELDKLKDAAKENSWGLLAEDPTPDDDVPTKLQNNKFVSLIYPLTDFLGTVPGYFEYDISAWFLGFMLVFFGIIFGDGGYGLLICAVSGLLIAKSYSKKKEISPTYLLIALLGGATILWGTLTCTWFGLAPEQLPEWLKAISLPVISNVYADKIWYPFWTNGEAGLTTAQNVQIFCFTLALVQLTVAHIMGAIRNRKSAKVLGDIGSILQLLGIFYIVLTLVVNGEVFGLGRVIGGVPIGTLSIALVGVGFAMSFIFANYEGSLKDSVLSSLKNIVSVLLGVVNVFSDIVSYIRLWAVGLAGAAISATVNELAGPMFGKLVFIIFAIILLVFGHGLNMILNVLSVIVHGVRLNTLEFSTHLDMSWSGHKYKPFEE